MRTTEHRIPSIKNLLNFGFVKTVLNNLGPNKIVAAATGKPPAKPAAVAAPPNVNKEPAAPACFN